MDCPECKTSVNRLTGENSRYPGRCRRCYGRAKSYDYMASDREVHNRKSREAQAKRRYSIGELKKGAGCADCGYNEEACALDFDHLDGKTRNVSELRSIKKIMEEIERHGCEVVCANCHRIRTRDRRVAQG